MSDPVAQFAEAVSPDASEFEVGLAINRVIDPSVNTVKVRDTCAGLTLDMEVALGRSIGVHELLIHLDDIGFGKPFAGDAGLNHSNLEWVLEHRKGIPISLALVLIETARNAGLSAVGLNNPGHFLVMLDGQPIDPLSLRVLDPQDLGMDSALDLTAMPQATARGIGLRMLNNLKALYLHTSQVVQALEMVDYQVAIAGEDPQIIASLNFERGEYWQQLGAFSAAKAAYETCLTTANGELVEVVNRKLANLVGKSETFH